MPTRDGLSQRDREELRDATLARFRDGEITATQARGELGNQGWNATQIKDGLNETMRLVVVNTLAASRKRRGI